MDSAKDATRPLTRRERQSIADALTRHGRRKTGLFLAEGLRCCTEALRNCPRAIRIVLLTEKVANSASGSVFLKEAERSGTAIRRVADAEFAKFAKTRSPQGVLCVLQRADLPPPPDLAQGISDPFVLILDRIADPGNLGTILRTAWAVGLGEVWLTDGTTDPYAPKAVRAGMGAQFSLVLRTVPTLDAARTLLRACSADSAADVWLAVPRGGVSCFSRTFDVRRGGLVIGNETSGVRPCADCRQVSIPMPGDAESLNAAQAATILLFETVRRGILGRSSAAGST